VKLGMLDVGRRNLGWRLWRSLRLARIFDSRGCVAQVSTCCIADFQSAGCTCLGASADWKSAISRQAGRSLRYAFQLAEGVFKRRDPKNAEKKSVVRPSIFYPALWS